MTRNVFRQLKLDVVRLQKMSARIDTLLDEFEPTSKKCSLSARLNFGLRCSVEIIDPCTPDVSLWRSSFANLVSGELEYHNGTGGVDDIILCEAAVAYLERQVLRIRKHITELQKHSRELKQTAREQVLFPQKSETFTPTSTHLSGVKTAEKGA